MSTDNKVLYFKGKLMLYPGLVLEYINFVVKYIAPVTSSYSVFTVANLPVLVAGSILPVYGHINCINNLTSYGIIKSTSYNCSHHTYCILNFNVISTNWAGVAYNMFLGSSLLKEQIQ